MLTKPKVALVMPHYGGVEAGAAIALCNAPVHPDGSKARGVITRTSVTSTSLLCQCFNRLLGLALDWRDEGTVTHLAMLHADLVPQQFCWVDTLLEQMASHRLDMVSAVVPIKEHERKKTSTAIGDTADPWKVNRYINVEDYGNTPETFTAADVCKPNEVLLVNTGCWVADLRLPFWDTFTFQIHDRIIREPDGSRTAQTRPEDWELSRAMNAAGVRYGATWALPVLHYGNGAWANRP